VLEYGDKEEWFRELAEEGKPVEALDRKPDVPLHLWPVCQAWLELHRHRQYGFSAPQPIAASDILAWLIIRGIEDYQRYYQGIAYLDKVYMLWMSQQSQSG
jgi:hypothetical protein